MRYSIGLKKSTAVMLIIAVIALALPFTAMNSKAATGVSDQQVANLCNYYDAATAFLTLYGDDIPQDVYVSLDTARSRAYPVFENGTDYDFGIAISDLRIALSVAEASLMGNPALANGAPGPVMGTFEGISAGLGGVSYNSAVRVAATYSSCRNLPISMVKTRIIGEFVERIYQNVLGRSADAEGMTYWVNGIESGRFTPNDVVLNFVNSQEFVSKNVDNAQYVTDLYRAFFDREPDTAGLNNWVNALNNGASRQDVARAFTGTQEWSNVCSFYGLDA